VKWTFALVGVAPLIACASNGHPKASDDPAALAGPGVLVGTREVLAVFPRSVGIEMTWPATRVASRWAKDQWRLMIPLDPRWLVAAHQLDVDSTLEVPARTSTNVAVGAGHLVDCELATHVLACSEPLKGMVEMVRGEVVFHIRDARWRQTLHSQRPRSAQLMFVRGGQEVVWQGVVDIEYQ
jgi:hypothetical protein